MNQPTHTALGLRDFPADPVRAETSPDVILLIMLAFVAMAWAEIAIPDPADEEW